MNTDLLNQQDCNTIKTMNTLEELISNMMNKPDKFNHLKIFLHREHTTLQPELGRKFLFISPDSFGLVRLNDLTVENNNIKLYLEDAFTSRSGTFTIDTDDKSIKFLLVAWEDIQALVVQDNCSNTTNKVIV